MKTVKLLFLKNLILGFALIMTMPALAQEYNIENVGRVGIRNSGTIMDGNIIKGYYFFYFSEKISKKENAYEIVVLDENLVEKSSSKMTDSKSAFLLEASYNGKNILFKFYDSKSKTVSYRTIDEAGKVSSKETREPDKTEQMTYLTAVTNELENTNLQAINDKLCGIRRKANAQTAHLVFADTKANAEKTKRAVFCQRSERNKKEETKI